MKVSKIKLSAIAVALLLALPLQLRRLRSLPLSHSLDPKRVQRYR